MRHAIWALALCFGVFLQSAMPLQAETRIALIVGNGAYVAMNPLASPVSDAEAMARTLEGLGFQVTLLGDADKAAISQAVAEFGSALREAGDDATGLFYYAGHAVQSQQRNYLLPVDIAVKDAADLDLLAIDADLVLRQMTSARNKTNIFILNANRASPFGDLPGLADSGLAEMTPPPGTFLAFAATPGTVAADDAPGSSAYAKALSALMISQGMAIEDVFNEVRIAVQELTGGVQTSWETSALTGGFTFAAPVSSPDEDKLWEDIKGSEDPVLFKFFLESYPLTGRRAEAEALLKAAEDAAAGAAAGAAAETPAEETAPTEIADLPGQVAAALQAAIAASDVTFEGPIMVGTPEIVGKSIKELITTKPLYAPIEGLPEEAWNGLQCSNCHQWEPVALCDQGKFYLTQEPPEAMEAQHPLGGTFKLNLKRWAEQGCN
jgi:uncharacterized caspase-like protein